MSSIEELQQRVVQAEERFGLINAERAKYSERLMGLIDAIETRLGDQLTEIERQAKETASQAEELEALRRDSAENKPLRGMLQSLLNAIELGNSVALSETMQALDTKISALIDESNAAETAPGEAEAPEAAPKEIETAEAETPEAEPDEAEVPEAEPQEIQAAEAETPVAEPGEAEVPEAEPQEIQAAEAETPEAEPGEAEVPEIEAAEPPEEESVAPEPEAAEIAEPEPELETAEAPELEAAATANAEEDNPNQPEEQGAAAEPEAFPEAIADVIEELTAADETQVAPEPAFAPEAEVGTAAPEVLDIPAIEADVTMIDEEMVIGAVSDDAQPLAEAVEENLVDESDAVLDVPAAPDAGEQKTEASSLEDIMRRVSKLVEDESALGPLAADGVQVDASAPGLKEQSPEPAEAPKTASGG